MWSRKELNAAVALERNRRIAKLRESGRKALEVFPSVSSEEEMFLGKKIAFTTFIESQQDGRLLVLVRSDERRFFGFISAGATDGFWFLSNGEVAEATDQDVLEFFA